MPQQRVRYVLFEGAACGVLGHGLDTARFEKDLSPFVSDVESGRVRLLALYLDVDLTLDCGVDEAALYLNGARVWSASNPWQPLQGCAPRRYEDRVPVDYSLIRQRPRVELEIHIRKNWAWGTVCANGSVALVAYVEAPEGYRPPGEQSEWVDLAKWLAIGAAGAMGVAVSAAAASRALRRRR